MSAGDLVGRGIIVGGDDLLHQAWVATTRVLPDADGTLSVPGSESAWTVKHWCQGCDRCVIWSDMAWDDLGRYHCARCRDLYLRQEKWLARKAASDQSPLVFPPKGPYPTR